MTMDGRRCNGRSDSGSRSSLVTETANVSLSAKDAARGEGSGEGSEYSRLLGFAPGSRQSWGSVATVCGLESDDAEPVPVVDSEADE